MITQTSSIIAADIKMGKPVLAENKSPKKLNSKESFTKHIH